MVSKATPPQGAIDAVEEEPEEQDDDPEAAEHADHAAWKPSANPWLIAGSVMTATFMVVLDSSVANVALPHIAGNLSASTDEATWVLTSYLVSNAIMLPATGWITRRIGRKRLLLISIALFTAASMLCGMALNMPMLIFSRILQGVGGGGMQPLAQSILLESFPRKDHAKAMAVYGMGIVVAPVIGPTLGGWITDSYSWRWIFYINLPVGLLALLLSNTFIEDPPYLHRKFAGKLDAIGFGVMALWLGALQLFLDKGQEADWFDATWIRWTFAVSMIAFVLFIWRELRARDPLVQLHVLLNRNFAIGTLLTTIYGFVLYSATAMLPLFLQTLMGYPALDSGLAVSPRGMGSMASMVIAGALANKIDRRLLMAFGFAVLGISGLMFARIDLDVSMTTVVLPNVLNGFSGGFIFVPLTTMAMGHLRKQEIGNATGIYNLMRNIGGSVGISAATALLERKGQAHQTYLAANLTGTDSSAYGMMQGLRGYLAQAGTDLVTAQHMAMGEVYRMLGQQAALLAYVDIFRLIGFLSLLCIPIVLLFENVRHSAGGHSEAPH